MCIRDFIRVNEKDGGGGMGIGRNSGEVIKIDKSQNARTVTSSVCYLPLEFRQRSVTASLEHG